MHVITNMSLKQKQVYLANTSIIIEASISTCTCNYEFWSEKCSTFLQLQNSHSDKPELNKQNPNHTFQEKSLTENWKKQKSYFTHYQEKKKKKRERDGTMTTHMLNSEKEKFTLFIKQILWLPHIVTLFHHQLGRSYRWYTVTTHHIVVSRFYVYNPKNYRIGNTLTDKSNFWGWTLAPIMWVRWPRWT